MATRMKTGSQTKSRFLPVSDKYCLLLDASSHSALDLACTILCIFRGSLASGARCTTIAIKSDSSQPRERPVVSNLLAAERLYHLYHKYSMYPEGKLTSPKSVSAFEPYKTEL